MHFTCGRSEARKSLETEVSQDDCIRGANVKLASAGRSCCPSMKTYFLDGVILRDFSPEEPALSEVEGMLSALPHLQPKATSAPCDMLRKLNMTPSPSNTT